MKRLDSLMRQSAAWAKTVLALPALTWRGDLAAVVGGSLWRPDPPDLGQGAPGEFLRVSLADTRRALDLGLSWMLRAQSWQPDGGVTAWLWLFPRYRLAGSYPEVTGYIIPTMLAAARLTQRDDLAAAARRMADFELAVQSPDGWWPGGVMGRLTGPSVFNSAMVVHGLLAAHQAFGAEAHLAAARRCGDWIVSVQEADGSWTRFNYAGLRRVYDTKVAESLLELWRAAGREEYREAARRNLAFAMSRQRPNGWWEDCDNSLRRNHEPLTHTIGYTAQGLISCGLMLDDPATLAAGRRAMDVLLRRFELGRDLLPGRYDENWRATVKSACLTGCAQAACCWQSLFDHCGDNNYLNAALKMADLLKATQFRGGSEAIRGGLPASYPSWGDYGPATVNSWTLKYFLDALIWEHGFKARRLAEVGP